MTGRTPSASRIASSVPTMRGFDIRGIGPRIVRTPYLTPTELEPIARTPISDALGGRAYYMGRLEVEFPATSALKNLGIRPSAFVDIGSVWKLTKPPLIDSPGTCFEPSDNDPNTTEDTQVLNPGELCPGAGTPETTDDWAFVPGFKETFVGNSVKPRLSIGIGVNWVSPFGPLRIDIAKALLKQDGDETKLFSFNVGTQF